MEKWSANSLWHNNITDFWKKSLVEENKTQKLKNPASYEGEHRAFSGKEAEWTETKHENIFVWENLLCDIYFLLIKFSRISYTGLHLCPFLSDVNQIFKCSRALQHCLLLKASGLMSNFLKSVIIFLGKNSELIMKDTKLKFSQSANYKVAFQNLSSLMKRKASSEKNFSTILNDICRIQELPLKTQDYWKKNKFAKVVK